MGKTAQEIQTWLLGNQGTIIPSTKLKTVNVHKIQDSMTCDRLYFWRWVMNIVPNKFNINFWFGAMIHSGMEEFAKTRSLKKAIAAIKAEDKKATKGVIFEVEMKEEVNLQRRIVIAMFEGFVQEFPKFFDEMVVEKTEVPFRVKLELSPVYFLGRIDSYGKYHGMRAIGEYKSASQIGVDYFRRLKFDKQINGYAIGYKSVNKKYPGVCPYVVFRKPAIRVRQNESVDLFVSRLEQDLHDRKDFYYTIYRHRFGKQSIEAVKQDIEWACFDLYSKFNYLNEDQIMNPDNWPRNDRACMTIGICPYFILCSHIKNFKLFLRLYKSRDIRYDGEVGELNMKRKYITNQSK